MFQFHMQHDGFGVLILCSPPVADLSSNYKRGTESMRSISFTLLKSFNMKLSFSLAVLVATIAIIASADSIDDKPNKWCMIKGGKCGEGMKKCCPGRVCLPSQNESDAAGTTRCYIGEEEENQ